MYKISPFGSNAIPRRGMALRIERRTAHAAS
jgi:hypothetical protein